MTACEPVYDETPRARADFFSEDEQVPEDPIIVAGYIDLHDPSERNDLLAESSSLQLATRNEELAVKCMCFQQTPAEMNVLQLLKFGITMIRFTSILITKLLNMGNLIRSTSGRDSNHRKFRCDLSEPVYDENRRAEPIFLLLNSRESA